MNVAQPTTTILTLRIDASSQQHFDALRGLYYPAKLNRIGAHLTLFHTLPATEAVRDALAAESARQQTFTMRVTGVRSLGRGVAYKVESGSVAALHQRLAMRFADDLSAQDRHRFQPHVVVQNKVSGDEAKALLTELSAGFQPYDVHATGLEWWDYLGGPWKLREQFAFSEAAD